MSELKFREATINDASEIARIVNASYRPKRGAEGWTHESGLVGGERTNAAQVEVLLRRSVILLGVHQLNIVACVQIELKGRDAHIGMLAVMPAMQSTGIGSALLAHAEAHAATALKAEQFVLVVVEARSELIEFYARRGYEQAEQGLPYPTHAGVGTPRRGELGLSILRKRSNTALNRKRKSTAPVDEYVGHTKNLCDEPPQ
ncbi:MAG: GNAT family N-acetyltransferase [Gammaproteobacteria bacterium]|jgi:N-acetylglutamate synthase-like GNAT family acetyltransferase